MVFSISKVGSLVPVGAMVAVSLLSAVSAMFCAGGECQRYRAGQTGYVAAGGRDVIAARNFKVDGRVTVGVGGRAGDGEISGVHILDGLAEGDPPGRGVRVGQRVPSGLGALSTITVGAVLSAALTVPVDG